jgi:hypothetical protein
MTEQIKRVRITTVRPSGDDLGACELEHYVVRAGMVTLCDQQGTPLHRGQPSARRGADRASRWEAPIEEGLDPHVVAAQLLWSRYRARASNDFYKPLRYPDIGVA